MEERRHRRHKIDSSLGSPPEVEVKFIDTFIGRGVFVKEDVKKHQFLMEYRGELSRSHGDDSYKNNTYMFFFKHNNKEYCIDASKNLCTAAMVNDIDPKNKPNCKMKKEVHKDGQPKLCLYAICDIKSGTELRYDYGVTSAPWRKKQQNRQIEDQCDLLSKKSRSSSSSPSIKDEASRALLPSMTSSLKTADQSVSPVCPVISDEPASDNMQDEASRALLPIMASSLKTADQSVSPVSPVISDEPASDNMQDEASRALLPSMACSLKTADHSVSPVSPVISDEPAADNMQDEASRALLPSTASSLKTADQSVSPASPVISDEPAADNMQDDASCTLLPSMASSLKTADQLVSPVSPVISDEPAADNMQDEAFCELLPSMASSLKTADQSVSPVSPVISNEPAADNMQDEASCALLPSMASSGKTADQLVSLAGPVISDEPAADNMQDEASRALLPSMASSGKTADQSVSPASPVISDEPVSESESASRTDFKMKKKQSKEIGTAEPLSQTAGALSSPHPSTGLGVDDADPAMPGTSILICTLVAMQDGVVDDIYAMCCNVLAIGSSRNNDIILKDAADHHAVLQASRFGEVFLFHHDSKLREGRYLGHNDTFTVGAKLFKLKYPQDIELNHPMASDGSSATVHDGKEDNCTSTSEPSKPCLTEGPKNSKSSATVRKDIELNHPMASDGSSATVHDGKEDNCTSTSEPSKPCLTEGPKNSKSSATVTKDIELNHPMASDGSSATVHDGKEDNCTSTSEPSKPCLTEGPKNSKSSATVTKEIEDVCDRVFDKDLDDSINDPVFEMTDSDKNMDGSINDPDFEMIDSDEDLDDSINDPDFEMKDSDVQSSEEFDDNDQAQGHVSDSSDQSDVIPCVKSLPALQIKKVTSSKSEIKNKASTSRAQQHSPSRIKIQYTNNSKDKRVWDKIHFCFYCKSKFTNITKHYFGPHRNEPEVKMILDHPKKSKSRSLALLKLRNAGDFQNNMTVLKNGEGTLITWARPDKEHATYKDYLPCEDCQAFFLRSNLWRHRQTCPFITTKAKNQKVQSQAQLLLPTSEKVSSGLKENVISKMVCDEVTLAARNDPIIVAVGEKLFRKHGHLPHLNTYVSQKMRELGRFLIKVREIDPKIVSMRCVMSPEKYPLAVNATRLLCKYKEDINKYSNPSLALKLGHLLKKCAKIQKSSSLIECDFEKGRKADEFLSLVEAEWTDDISSSALQTLASQKMNKGDMLPISEDILKLQAYFNDQTKNITDHLEKTFSKPEWDELNQMTLARVVLFNRRRGGETERITLEEYDKRLSKTDILREVELTLSPVEKMLCSTFERVEIRGKKGRTVPVLLTPDILKCIDLLLKWRKEANVDQMNPFLFPRPNNSLQALRTTDVLRKFARLANLKYPKNLTSTKLRKHVATVSQILNLSRNDLEIMANFMGHDIEIHRSFYRIPQETLQVARMGKLLSAFDRGTISRYSGKSLDDIALDEELSSEDECDDDVLSNDDTSVHDETDDPWLVHNETDDPWLVHDETDDPGLVHDETDDPGLVHDEIDDPGLVHDETDDPGLVWVSRSRFTSKRPALEMECNLLAKRPRNQDRTKESCQVASSSRNQTSRKSSSSPKKARKIQNLTEEQRRCIRRLFQANVTMRRELKKMDCINAIQRHKCLSSLDWTKIKNTVHNWITGEKRKSKQISKYILP